MRWCWVSVVIVPLLTQGQARTNLEDPEWLIDRLFQVQDEDVNYEEFYESLFVYFTHPVNLNTADRPQLESLYILSSQQITQLLKYRSDYGDLLSIYELQAVPEFDLVTIQQLIPFATIENKADGRPLMNRILSNPDNYLLVRTTRRIQRAAGFQKEGAYDGDRNHLYTRFRTAEKGDYSLGFTFEKDAGETLETGPGKYMFDFISFHVQLEKKGLLDNLVLGDYQMQFGQGLIYGAGFNPGKGAETVNTTMRSSIGLRPYTSILETGFFRGAAGTFGDGALKATVSYSAVEQDANLVTDSPSNTVVASIPSSGLHRTDSELENRNELNERSFGFNVEFRPNRHLRLGVNSLITSFSTPIQRPGRDYNQFEFNGDRNVVAGAYADYIFHNLHGFGEVARSGSGGTAYVVGVVSSLSPGLDFSYVHRSYGRNFHSFYGNAFAENSRVINEKGHYWGLKFRPGAKHLIAGYYDTFQFPWLKFRVATPSRGFEYLGRYTWSPSREMAFFIQFRQENKERNIIKEGTNLQQVGSGRKRNLVVNADYRMSKRISLKTRVQVSQYRILETTTSGIALVQDLNLTFDRFRIGGRFALFDTDDFENRQYVYERDVLYAFSIPAYNRQGTRRYIIAQYRVSRNFTVWLKYASTRLANTEAIGSGPDLITGDTRSDLRVQIRLKY